jgi:hypothetical protein
MSVFGVQNNVFYEKLVPLVSSCQLFVLPVGFHKLRVKFALPATVGILRTRHWTVARWAWGVTSRYRTISSRELLLLSFLVGWSGRCLHVVEIDRAIRVTLTFLNIYKVALPSSLVLSLLGECSGLLSGRHLCHRQLVLLRLGELLKRFHLPLVLFALFPTHGVNLLCHVSLPRVPTGWHWGIMTSRTMLGHCAYVSLRQVTHASLHTTLDRISRFHKAPWRIRSITKVKLGLTIGRSHHVFGNFSIKLRGFVG